MWVYIIVSWRRLYLGRGHHETDGISCAAFFPLQVLLVHLLEREVAALWLILNLNHLVSVPAAVPVLRIQMMIQARLVLGPAPVPAVIQNKVDE